MYARVRLGVLTASAVAAIAVPLAATSTAHEPKQPASPEQIIEYYDGGHYDEHVAEITRKATRSLRSQLRKDPRRPAIVFDIDDTLESTYACARRSNFDGNGISSCQANFDQIPIKPVWRLLRYAQKKRVSVFIITHRSDGIRDGTINQLREDGLRGRYRLITRPDDESGRPVADFKAGAREEIDDDGYTVLVNIGDQKSDLSGGFAAKRYKVANPMYTTP